MLKFKFRSGEIDLHNLIVHYMKCIVTRKYYEEYACMSLQDEMLQKKLTKTPLLFHHYLSFLKGGGRGGGEKLCVRNW